MASRNSWRSSALSMASAVAPIISTSNLSSVPWRRSDSAQFSAVCPPMVGNSAKPPGMTLRSFSMILATISAAIGLDGARMGIDEDARIPLFLQRLDRLGPRIIEFASLADHDGTGADDQD